MDGKFERFRSTLEKLPNGLTSLEFADPVPFPYRIFRIQGRDRVGIIVGIAVVAILMLQLFDRFDIFD
jgi:hypothetical protein